MVPFFFGKYYKVGTEFTIWKYTYISGIVSTFMSYFLILGYGKIPYFTFFYVLNSIFNSIYSTIDFINCGSFCNRISDKNYGGTFLTFLACCINFGGSLSGSVSLYFLDFIDLNLLVFLGIIYAVVYYFLYFQNLVYLQDLNKDSFRL